MKRGASEWPVLYCQCFQLSQTRELYFVFEHVSASQFDQGEEQIIYNQSHEDFPLQSFQKIKCAKLQTEHFSETTFWNSAFVLEALCNQIHFGKMVQKQLDGNSIFLKHFLIGFRIEINKIYVLGLTILSCVQGQIVIQFPRVYLWQS